MDPDGQKNRVYMDADRSALIVMTRLSRRQLLGLILLPLVLWLLWQLWVVAALLLLAVIVAAGLEPAVSQLEARGLSRAVVVLGLYAVILAVLGSLGYVVSDILANQVQSLLATLPVLMMRLQNILDTHVFLTGLGSMPDWIAGASVRAAGYAGLVVQGILAGLLVLLVAFYLLLDGRRLWRIGLRLVPDEHQAIVDVLGQEMAGKLRGYLQGVALSGLAVGILTGIGLAILGVPYALLFGVLAALLEAIPFFGPLLAAIGPFILALAQRPIQALIVAVFFIAVQQIEDKALVPRLQSHTTGLHPLTVILATLVLGSLFGFFGIILAVPLAAAGQALGVCIMSCFYHPDGTAAWLAERRPHPASKVAVQGTSADTQMVEGPA